MDSNRNNFPIWIGGILLALVLILLSTRSGGVGNPALTQRFVPRPTDPNAPTAEPFKLPQVYLPSLPPDAQRTLIQLRDRLAGGETIPALTPVVSGPRIRVEVSEVKRSAERVMVHGTVTNIADRPVAI